MSIDNDVMYSLGQHGDSFVAVGLVRSYRVGDVKLPYFGMFWIELVSSSGKN